MSSVIGLLATAGLSTYVAYVAGQLKDGGITDAKNVFYAMLVIFFVYLAGSFGCFKYIVNTDPEIKTTAKVGCILTLLFTLVPCIMILYILGKAKDGKDISEDKRTAVAATWLAGIYAGISWSMVLILAILVIYYGGKNPYSNI